MAGRANRLGESMFRMTQGPNAYQGPGARLPGTRHEAMGRLRLARPVQASQPDARCAEIPSTGCRHAPSSRRKLDMWQPSVRQQAGDTPRGSRTPGQAPREAGDSSLGR